MSKSTLRHRCAYLMVISATAFVAACGGGDGESPFKNAGSGSESSGLMQAQAVWGGATDYSLKRLKNEGWSVGEIPYLAKSVITQDTVVPNAASNQIVYVDSQNGSLTNNGLSRSKPLKLLSQLTVSGLKGKKAVLLSCGSKWTESLTLWPETVEDAAALDNLVIGVYNCLNASNPGKGVRPLIQGSKDFTDASKWTKESVNGVSIWQRAWTESTPPLAIHRGTKVHMRTMVPASHPNQTMQSSAEFIRVSGAGDRTSMILDDATVSKFNGESSKLVGAMAYIKTKPWIVETAEIVAFDPSTRKATLKAIDPNTRQVIQRRNDSETDGMLQFAVDASAGFILAGKSWMLDHPDEWYYDPTKKLVQVGSNPDPTVSGYTYVNATFRDIGLHVRWIKGMRVEKVSFAQFALDGIRMIETSLASVENVHFIQNSQRGIYVVGGNQKLVTEEVSIRDSLFRNSGYAAIELREVRGAQVVRNDVGWHPNLANTKYAGDNRFVRGSIGSIVFAGNMSASSNGRVSRIAGNVVRNSPSSGVRTVSTSDVEVVDNTIVSFCEMFADCGGIYVGGPGPWNDLSNASSTPRLPVETVGRGGLIENNKVIGGYSNYSGYWHGKSKPDLMATGVYLDETSNKVQVRNNLIGATEIGIQLHDAFSNVIEKNAVRRVSRASLLAGQTRSELILRNNVIANNSFESYRSVRIPEYKCSAENPLDCTEIVGLNEEDSVFAQVWTSTLFDVKDMFDPDVVAMAPNRVYGNIVTSSGNGIRPVWRRQENAEMGDGGGAIWMMHSKSGVLGSSVRNLVRLGRWLEVSKQSALPVEQREAVTRVASYKQYALSEDAGSLVSNGSPMSPVGWTFYSQDVTPRGQFTVRQDSSCDPACGELSSGSTADYLASNSFNVSNRASNNLYVLRFGARSTSASSPASLRFFTLLDATYDPTGLNTPSVILPSGDFTQFEQLFYGRTSKNALVSDALSSKLYVKAVGSSPEFLNRVAQFRNLTLNKANGTPVYRPAMGQLTHLLVNASAVETYQVDDLPAGTWTDEVGARYSGSVTLKPGQWLQLYRKDTDWRADQ